MRKNVKAIIAALSASIMCAAPVAASFASTTAVTSITAEAASTSEITYRNMKYILNPATKEAQLSGVNFIPLDVITTNEVRDTLTWHGITYKITSIKDSAFRGNTNLRTVDLSAATNLKDLGKYTFMECTNLTSVKLSSSVTKMGNCDFAECTNLSDFDFVSTQIDDIYPYAFRNCKKLKSINIPHSVTNISASAFCGSGLTSVFISNNVESIHLSAFQMCDNLKKVVLEAGGNKTLEVYRDAFAYCPNLTSVYAYRTNIDAWHFVFEGSKNVHIYGAGASQFHS